jgi:hypothetical protein
MSQIGACGLAERRGDSCHSCEEQLLEAACVRLGLGSFSSDFALLFVSLAIVGLAGLGEVPYSLSAPEAKTCA